MTNSKNSLSEQSIIGLRKPLYSNTNIPVLFAPQTNKQEDKDDEGLAIIKQRITKYIADIIDGTHLISGNDKKEWIEFAKRARFIVTGDMYSFQIIKNLLPLANVYLIYGGVLDTELKDNKRKPVLGVPSTIKDNIEYVRTHASELYHAAMTLNADIVGFGSKYTKIHIQARDEDSDGKKQYLKMSSSPTRFFQSITYLLSPHNNGAVSSDTLAIAAASIGIPVIAKLAPMMNGDVVRLYSKYTYSTEKELSDILLAVDENNSRKYFKDVAARINENAKRIIQVAMNQTLQGD